MAKRHSKSPQRTDYRSVRDKFNDASKLLSTHMSNSRTDVSKDVLLGYHLVAGEFKARNGEMYQLQLKAVRSKKHFLKEQSVVPIFSKWAIGVKARIYFSGLINELFKN